MKRVNNKGFATMARRALLLVIIVSLFLGAQLGCCSLQVNEEHPQQHHVAKRYDSRTEGLQWYFHNVLDKDRNGYMDKKELRGIVCMNEAFCLSQGHAVIESKLEYVMHELDLDSSGGMSLKEMLAVTQKKGLHKGDVGDPIEHGVQQVHLSLTTDPTEMVVMWVTKDAVNSSVLYGITSGQLTMVETGTHTTYDVGVDGWSGWIHTVLLKNLKPDHQYYYKCVSGQYSSQEFSFTTAPVPSTVSKYVFAVVADMGTVIPMGWAVTDQVTADNEEYNFSFVLHAGDVAYAGTGHEWEFEEVWDLWSNQVEKIAAIVPYMFAVGNHEKYYNYTSYRTRFLMPGPQSGGEHNFWYSIHYGNARFVFMSTEHPYTIGSPQREWLEQVLQNAQLNRKDYPWLIVIGHRPMYCSDVDEWSSHQPGASFQTEIEPLFIKYNVDLYLCGHMHMYERIHPVVNGTVVQSGSVYDNPGATAHVVQATAGVFTDRTYIQPQPAWSASRDDKWGYGRMTVHNTTHLEYQFIHQHDNAVLDSFWILK